MLKKLRNRTVVPCLLATAAFGLVPSASATSSYDRILDVTIESSTSVARIAMVNVVTGTRPGCHNPTYTQHYGFDISTKKGEALLALAHTAFRTGKRVSVNGTATTCTYMGLIGSLETISSLVLYNN